MNLVASTLLTILSTLSPVESHSWLDCIGKSSTAYSGHNQYYGNEFYHQACDVGFPRGYPGRMNRWINDIYTYQLVGRKPDGILCSPITQSTANYTAEFHKGEVKAGDEIKLWWEADNHFNPGPTYVHVYSSKQAGKDLIKYSELNKDTLLWTNVFATDANCMDRSPNSLCWGNMKLPADLAPGDYQFVWQWVWDQNPVGEEYLTCFDLKVTGNGNQPSPNPATINPAPTVTSANINPQKLTAATSAIPTTTAQSNPSEYIVSKEELSQSAVSAPAPEPTHNKRKCHRKTEKKY